METPKKPVAKDQQPNIWPIISGILAIALVGVIVFYSSGLSSKGDEAVVTDQEAADNFLDFITEVYGDQISPINLKEVTETQGLYKVDFTITDTGQTVDQTVYMTKDGKSFTAQMVVIEEAMQQYREYQAALEQQQIAPTPTIELEPVEPVEPEEGTEE